MKQLLAFVFVTMFGVFSFAQSKEALGDYKGVMEVNKAENETYYYFVRFEKQPMDVIISFDKNNKISGLLISSEHREFKKKK
ncbi:DUF3887 domain-containing protein [Bergeyella zoohelcum]|uniref:DUF3887 domain-containing protein n=1 Tax=Bergeyella zoohelcum TaxID=1015 RepID=UPI002A91D2F8|nr:hypothetical protein [Bergeyella zoohelcum]MDY6025583.1 hypothetical protein [Bergeyella zoohelcum]